MNSMSATMIAGLILTPAMIAAGQVLFKLASRSVGEVGFASLLGLVSNGYLVAALVIYGAGTVIWIYLLRSVPLNVAYAFMALTFVLVPILSVFLLGETMTSRQVVATCLIICGLVLAAI